MQSNEVECLIDFAVNDSHKSISALANRMAPIFSNQVAPWHLDLSRCRYFGPDAVVVIIATILEARVRNQPCRVTLPQGPSELVAFCAFSGLLHFLDGSDFPDPSHPQNSTMPARVIRRAVVSDSNPVTHLVRRYVPMNEETAEYLGICVNEVIHNVEDHASSAVGAVMCARFLTKHNQVRVAIAIEAWASRQR
jgi:hypothetical protein